MYVWPCPSRPPLGAVQVYVCGHSLGGALATLCAYDLAGRKCVRVGVREKRVAPKRCLVLAVMSSCCSTLLYISFNNTPTLLALPLRILSFLSLILFLFFILFLWLLIQCCPFFVTLPPTTTSYTLIFVGTAKLY